MKKANLFHTLLPLTLAVTTLFSSNISAEECFDVSGKIKTKNQYFLSPEGIPTNAGIQTGRSNFTLTDAWGDEVIHERGNVFGQIVLPPELNFPFLTVTLNHTLSFPGLGAISTFGDVAVSNLLEARALDVEGNACSLYAIETVSSGVGTGFFANMTSINLTVEGFTSFCLDENNEIEENKNIFREISGSICFAE